MNFKKIQEFIGEGRTLVFSFSSKGDIGTLSALIKNPTNENAYDLLPPFTVTAPLETLESEFIKAFHPHLVNTVQNFNSAIDYDKAMREAKVKTKQEEDRKKKIKDLVDKYEKIKKEDGFNYGDTSFKRKIDTIRMEMMKIDKDHKIVTEVLEVKDPTLF